MPVVCLLVAVGAAVAQPLVDPRNMYERVIAIVPIVGQGTDSDPRRPMYAPVLSVISTPVATLTSETTTPVTSAPPATPATPLGGSTGILGYAMVESDDGKSAIVEFVAHDQSIFQNMLADATIQVFLKGRDTPQAAEASFQKLKAGFSITNLAVRLVP